MYVLDDPNGTLHAFELPLPRCAATDLGTISRSTARSGEWSERDNPGACIYRSEVDKAGFARWFTFTLAERKEVHISLNSSDTIRDPDLGTFPKFTPRLYVREGDGIVEGAYLAQSGSTDDVDVYKVLDAGTYTVEATNLEPGETGRFNIAIHTRTLTDPPATTGDVPASCHTVSLEQAGTYTGEWGPGPADADISCRSQGAGAGGYARYYDFHLTQQSRVTITLESDHATPRLYLRGKGHQHWQIRAGVPNQDRWLSPHEFGQYSNGDSRISDTLPPGSYTIQAASNEAGQRGEFTLRVQGSGIQKVPDLPALVYCADTPDQTLTEGTQITGQWGPGCESGAAHRWNFARFYNFSIEERRSVTITLRDTDMPTGDYGLVLRRGTSLSFGADQPAQYGSILDSAFSEGNGAALTIDLQQGDYWIEAYGAWPSEFTLRYATANPSPASNCFGRTIREDSEVEGRWFNDCRSVEFSVTNDETGQTVVFGGNKPAAYYDLNVTGVSSEQTKRLNIRLRSFDSSAELRLWNASDFTPVSGANRSVDSDDARPVASAGSNPNRAGRSALHVDLQRGRYVVEVITDSVNRIGRFRLGVTTGEEAPDYVRENCGEMKRDVGVVALPWTKIYKSKRATTRTANQNDSSHADYIPFGYHIGDEIIKLGQKDVNACTGNAMDGWPVWHFVFTVESWASISFGPNRDGERTVDGPLSTADASLVSTPPPGFTLRKIGGHYRGYRDDGTPYLDHPADRYFFTDITKAPDWTLIPCKEAMDDGTPAVIPPCDADAGVFLNFEPGTYAVTLSFDPVSGFEISPGAFGISFSINPSIPPTGYNPQDRLGRLPEGTENQPEPERPSRVPEFDADTMAALASLTIAENSPAGTLVGLPVTFTDPDGDTLSYSLSGTDASSFAIDSGTGQIATVAGVTYDYDTKPSYSLRVTADDGRGRQITTSATVNLTNVNEWPEFDEGESTTRELAENSAGGTNVGLPVTATDPEGDGLLYIGLDGARADVAAFALDPDTGQLTTVDGVIYDYETKPSYQIMVVVMELDTEDSFLSGINVTVNLTDVEEGGAIGQANEEPPNRAPNFDAGIVTTLSVAENSPAGTSVGSPITATDPDGDSLTYSLSGTDAGSFAIGESTGQITTIANETYDFETDSSYSLAVDATDGTLTVSTPVTVTLTDVNEASEIGEGNLNDDGVLATTRQVAENSPAGTSVGAPITATDPDDGDTLTFSLAPTTDAGSFAIDAATGQIATVADVSYDYETKSSYEIIVVVADSDNLLDAIVVTVNLTDVDETGGTVDQQEPPVNRAPSFDAGVVTNLSAAENSPAGTNVGSPITATDPDGDSLIYSLSGTDASSFEIGSSTGQITTKTGETYNYEAKSSYSLTVEATDDDGLSDSVAVTVSLTNVDEAPTVSDTSQFRNHAATVGQAFSLTLPAADANSGDGGPYEYLLWHRGQGQNFMDQAINGLSFNAETRTLSGTPAASGVWELSYVVHDNDANRSVADRFRARTNLQVTVSE